MSIIDVSKLSNTGLADAVESISEDVIVGGTGANTIVNRVFTYRFSQIDIQEIRRIYQNLNIGEINDGRIYNAISGLRSVARDMRSNNSFPLEPILYASKEINSLLSNNEILVDRLGDLITEIYKTSEYKYKIALQYIIENWKWTQQLNIAINACGKIKDEELLELVYVNITNETKAEAFKAFINSGLQTSIPNIMKCMATVQDGDILSNKICKYFNQYYQVNFGEDGISSAREYVRAPHFSRRAKKEINKILPVNEINKAAVTLGDMINLCKTGDVENFNTYIKNDKLRRIAYISLRWVPKENDFKVKAESLIINGLTNMKNKSTEVGEAMITLAILNSDKLESLARKNLKNNVCVEYCYAALILAGHSIYEEKLLDEIFENENISAYSALNHCKNRMGAKAIERLDDYLNSNNSLKIIKGLKASVDFVNRDSLELKTNVINSLRNVVDKNNEFENSNVRVQFMKTLELIFDDKTKDKLIPILFKINENQLCTVSEKAKAKALLLSVGADVPR